MFRRKPKPHPDYEHIAQLEIELGLLEPSPAAKITSYAAPKRVEVLTSTDPDRPVLKMIWDGEG